MHSAHAQSLHLFLWKWGEGGIRLKYFVTFPWIISSELCVLVIAELMQKLLAQRLRYYLCMMSQFFFSFFLFSPPYTVSTYVLSEAAELFSKLRVTHSQTGLAVNGEKYKYVVMFREQNAGQNHNVTTGNKAFESD